MTARFGDMSRAVLSAAVNTLNRDSAANAPGVVAPLAAATGLAHSQNELVAELERALTTCNAVALRGAIAHAAASGLGPTPRVAPLVERARQLGGALDFCDEVWRCERGATHHQAT